MAFLSELQSARGKKLRKTKTRVGGKEKHFLDSGGRPAQSGWVNVPDIHLPRSKFDGDPFSLHACKPKPKTKKAKSSLIKAEDAGIGGDDRSADAAAASTASSVDIKVESDEEKKTTDIITTDSTAKGTDMDAEDTALKVDSEDDDEDDDLPIVVTIVHISDTHQKHGKYDSRIPSGDILVHTGDFVNYNTTDVSEVREFNEWIKKKKLECGFQQCIVIGGNHENCLMGITKDQIQKELLNECVYLENSSVRVFGLHFYGTPMNNCAKMSFGCDTREKLAKHWSEIPTDTDVLLTHSPPLGLFDLAWHHTYNFTDPCWLCSRVHTRYGHWGNPDLLREVRERIQPTLHLFGHVHDDVGHKQEGNTTFVNSAMDIRGIPHKIKLVFDL